MKYIKLFEDFTSFDLGYWFDGFLCHGTSSNKIESILEKGFTGYSCWGSYDMAVYYASACCEEEGGSPVVISVEFNKFDKNLFQKDNPSIAEPITSVLEDDEEDLAEMWANVEGEGTWKDCLEIYQSVAYEGTIRIADADVEHLKVYQPKK